jgi:hypothetical protein
MATDWPAVWWGSNGSPAYHSGDGAAFPAGAPAPSKVVKIVPSVPATRGEPTEPADQD